MHIYVVCGVPNLGGFGSVIIVFLVRSYFVWAADCEDFPQVYLLNSYAVIFVDGCLLIA